MNIDLGNISDKLKKEFTQIERIYLFGSRRHNTKSSRSDIDLLIEFGSHVKQKEILEYSNDLSPALDIFKLEEGKATSFHNDSFIQYESKAELLEKVNAVELWNGEEGRLNADIAWIVKIDERASYPPTALPNKDFTKNKFPNSNPAELEVRQLFGLIGRVKTGQLWILILGMVAVGTLIFKGGTFYAELTNKKSEIKERMRWSNHVGQISIQT